MWRPITIHSVSPTRRIPGLKRETWGPSACKGPELRAKRMTGIRVRHASPLTSRFVDDSTGAAPENRWNAVLIAWRLSQNAYSGFVAPGRAQVRALARAAWW